MAVIEALPGSAREGKFNVQLYSKSVSIIFAFYSFGQCISFTKPIVSEGKDYPRVRIQRDMDVVRP